MKTPEFLSVAAAQRLANVDYRTFRKIINRGEITTHPISKTRRIVYRRELLQWLRQNGANVEER